MGCDEASRMELFLFFAAKPWSVRAGERPHGEVAEESGRQHAIGESIGVSAQLRHDASLRQKARIRATWPLVATIRCLELKLKQLEDVSGTEGSPSFLAEDTCPSRVHVQSTEKKLFTKVGF